MIDVKKVEEILKLYRQYDLPGLKLHFGDELVVISQQVEPQLTSASATPLSPSLSSTTEPSTISESSQKSHSESDLLIIKSPFVGTFYAAPGPDQEPFVKTGAQVKKGQTIGIVEAMKILNEVKSEVEGQVMEILVQDGQMIEFGTPLMKIIPCL